MHRVGALRPDLVEPFTHVAREYIGSGDATEKGHAVLALITLGAEKNRDALEQLASDQTRFRYYDGNGLAETEIGELAREALG